MQKDPKQQELRTPLWPRLVLGPYEGFFEDLVRVFGILHMRSSYFHEPRVGTDTSGPGEAKTETNRKPPIRIVCYTYSAR